MSTYDRRVIDGELDEFQPRLRAIVLQAAKAVGKSATATQRARSVFDPDDERQRLLIRVDPGVIESASFPVLIDEWQHVPIP
jgi:hypothetical protein